MTAADAVNSELILLREPDEDDPEENYRKLDAPPASPITGTSAPPSLDAPSTQFPS